MHSGARYGILGGTFDPPHLGHLVLAQEVFARLGLDRVWFVPTGSPPHKVGQRITAAEHRRAMVELAIAGDARFALSTVELERAGPSYTVDTLRLLRATWGEASRICLVLGWDMLLYLPSWHDPRGVIAAADEIAAVHRPGFDGDPDALAQSRGSIARASRQADAAGSAAAGDRGDDATRASGNELADSLSGAGLGVRVHRDT